MYYGNGFTHSDVYNMPSYLRSFYYNKLIKAKKEEKKKMDESTKKSKPPMNPRFKR
jgi:hypothetical protein